MSSLYFNSCFPGSNLVANVVINKIKPITCIVASQFCFKKTDEKPDFNTSDGLRDGARLSGLFSQTNYISNIPITF